MTEPKVSCLVTDNSLKIPILFHLETTLIVFGRLLMLQAFKKLFVCGLLSYY